MTRTLLSWNVNGIRSAERQGFCDWLTRESPWLVAVQETKAHPEQVSEVLRNPPGYHTYWDSAEKKGYSGVAVFCREEPISIENGLGEEWYDHEGRTLVLEFDDLVVVNCYFPNGKKDSERLKFKIGFYRAFFSLIERLRTRRKTILACGDFNTAHREIDLARPRENSMVSGFLPEERALLDEFLAMGFVDTLRAFHPEPDIYTWWDQKSRARDRNIGWRIDYWYIDRESLPRLTDAVIRPEIAGSDHCPASITLGPA